jgi:hypothetical protein
MHYGQLIPSKLWASANNMRFGVSSELNTIRLQVGQRTVERCSRQRQVNPTSLQMRFVHCGRNLLTLGSVKKSAFRLLTTQYLIDEVLDEIAELELYP